MWVVLTIKPIKKHLKVVLIQTQYSGPHLIRPQNMRKNLAELSRGAN